MTKNNKIMYSFLGIWLAIMIAVFVFKIKAAIVLLPIVMIAFILWLISLTFGSLTAQTLPDEKPVSKTNKNKK